MSVSVNSVSYERVSTSKAGTCCDGKCTYYDGTSKFLTYEGAFGSYYVTTAASEDACSTSWNNAETYPLAEIQGTTNGEGACVATSGAGTFPSMRVLTTSQSGAMAVFAIDVNADGAIDVISASEMDDTVEWWRPRVAICDIFLFDSISRS